MGWFKRIKEGITTSSKDKKEIPEGLWYKCPECKATMPSEDHAMTYWVCSSCGFHERVGSEEYFSILFDDGEYTEFNENMSSGDPLEFQDTKKYVVRIAATQKKSGLTDALRSAYGNLEGEEVVIACMDFAFIGGSMGSVVGEKIAKGIDMAIKRSFYMYF
jgi:acetyl-CoA carboxylase carboxyl transferase subunit beta